MFRREKNMPSLNAHVEQRLRTDWWVWLITVRPDGRPHVILVGFFWDGQTFLIFSEPNKQKLRNVRHNPHVMLALDGTGNLGDDVVVVEGTAELLNETTLSILRAYPAIGEKYDAWVQLGHEAGWLDKDRDLQAVLADYTQPIRVTPTRFLLGAAMQSVYPGRE
jgi:PPOX class probable F420-dependent enzyme